MAVTRIGQSCTLHRCPGTPGS